MQKVRTCLWFDNGAQEAAKFYVSLIPGSHIETVETSPDASQPYTVVEFVLGGVPYMLLEAGPHFTQSEAVSISVHTKDQAETDRLWAALTADGGAENMCGWCKDRWGVSWQIIPEALVRLTRGPKGTKALAAMMTMRKIDIATLEAAAE